MTGERLERRLAAVLAADVAGYSRLMGLDEEDTLARLKAIRKSLVDPTIAAHRGRIVKTTGDGLLVEFASAVDAVRGAVEVQRGMAEQNGSLPQDQRIEFRIGIHVGDIIFDDSDIFGDGVNIAARLEGIAEPGGVCMSNDAYRQVRGKVEIFCDDMGPRSLKNIAEPMHAWRVKLGDQGTATAQPGLPASHAPALALPDKPSIAVLPLTNMSGEPVIAVLAFDNISNDADMQFFSDGVSEEIIHRLSSGARLKVIGRTSSFQFRGERKADAALNLGCSHVLDGSVRRAAGRVRVSAHLMEVSSRATLWSDRYDRSLEDIFAVQDDISDNIARALDRTFSSSSLKSVDPTVYDLYLRASPRSFSPDELRTNVGILEVAVKRAPHFAEAWGRLAYLRSFLHFYQGFADRAAIVARVTDEATCALALEPENDDAIAAQLFVLPPFGHFLDVDILLERLRRVPGSGDGRKYIGYILRTMGRVREGLEETEQAYRLDILDTGTANGLALARLSAGRLSEAASVYEDLVDRVPEMSFPVSSLLRVCALQKDWGAVDRLLDLAAKRQLREFQEGLPFIQALRHPTPENIGSWLGVLRAHVAKTGCVDVSRLVYAAHLGLVDEAYRAAEGARLGPAGTADDIMGPDRYRTHLLFQVSMPELRNDTRFPRLCARLGLVEFWLATDKWPDCADEVPYDFRAECLTVKNVEKDKFGV